MAHRTKQPVDTSWKNFENDKSTVLKLLCDGHVTKEIALQLNQPYRRVRYMIELMINEHGAKCLHHLTAIVTEKRIENKSS